MFPEFVTQYQLPSCVVGTAVPDPWPWSKHGIVYAEGKGMEAVKCNTNVILSLAFAAAERSDLVWDYPRRNMFERIFNSATRGNSTNGIAHSCLVNGCEWYLDVKLRYKENDFCQLFFREEETLFLNRKYDLILPQRFKTTTLSSILSDLVMHPETRERYEKIVVVAGRGEQWS